MSEAQKVVEEKYRASAAGQGLSAGLGGALGASMVGLGLGPAAFVGVLIGTAFLGAKRLADDQKETLEGDR